MTNYSSFGLNDKIAIVTGPSQGIGRAIALGLAAAGAHLVLAKHPDGRQEEVRQLQSEIEAMGRKTLLVMTDVSRVAELRALMQKTTETFGRIDILVNNAALLMSYGQLRAHEMSNEEWDRTLNVNLRGYWLCSKYVIPPMLSQKSGNILFIGSRTGLRGFSGFSAYSASKGGVLALMRSMAADYAPEGIRVNAIIPGTMDTPMNAQEFSEPGARDKYIPRIPARRLGVATDIAGIATFLATEEASFCIGGLYFADGGAELG